MRTVSDVQAEIQHYESLLKEDDCSLTAQTWIELQLKELRKELKSVKKEMKKS